MLCREAHPLGVFAWLRYVLGKESPQLWENDNDGVKMYFEAYMRDNCISPDDARSLRDAQTRAGATFTLQAGPYSGLEQNVKARVLVAKKLKTDYEDRKYVSMMNKLSSRCT